MTSLKHSTDFALPDDDALGFGSAAESFESSAPPHPTAADASTATAESTLFLTTPTCP
ncbi:hypothetical protein [Streptomyces sp. 2A115]|uniref:hypothetical protein n=1 Tax=Streptomyces sp. 2A115 TaxID=3457439 RepID=UPI003FD5E0B5